ncbi:MAG TPA: hypothetical protein VN943_15745 [Candidatus Acidoferrum sp.]|nr:hypothetical protein [Candidatus Acidoferrum sp.]
MKMDKKFAKTRNAIAAAAGLSLLAMAGNCAEAKAQEPAAAGNAEKRTVVQSKFYCNIKALSPAERASHTQLTDKLMALRRATVESEKGYEFQYSPKEVSLSELAEWVVAEGKCCPFFDFHLDLEREGSLLCLRLTGVEGIKAFIRAELPVGTK